MVLRDWLSEPHSRFADRSLMSSRFQKSLAKSNSPHWALATGQDLRFLKTSSASKLSRFGRLLHWYTDRVLFLAHEEPDLHTLLAEIGQLVKSPTALFHPKVVLRVLGITN